jgi:uncharacterized protein (DUF362 family)
MTLNSACNNKNPEVNVCGGLGPYENTREALSFFDLSLAKGKKVLLKPNIGRVAEPGTGITTEPLVVAAAADAFMEAGASVAIGESPITGVTIQEAFDASGMTRIAQERSIRLIDLDARPFTPLEVPEGRAIESLKVCPEVLEYDVLVSIPVMKMHMHTRVTLAVKNMKGCLWKRSKVKFHMLPPVKGSDEKSINIAISDMSGALRPDFSIVDGTTGMEGMGPGAGSPKALDVVVAGFDSFAADAVACRIMGTSAKDVPHLRIGAERGYGVIDLEKIAVYPQDWRKYISPFVFPPEKLEFEFPNIRVLDENSCSACQSTLLLFLKKNHSELLDYFPALENLTIAIGKGNKDVPAGSLCIGNCAAAHKEKGIFVQGCPPVGSEIINTIKSSVPVSRLNQDKT